MKIALISPKGPLYRHRGGIFRKSLRYQPLTLTTLASLVPPELNARIEVFDEGIQDVPEQLDADLVGMTVITGTSKRAYELARRFRGEGKTVILGGPHVTLVPDEAAGHADAVVVGYAEDSWPELLHDFAGGTLKREYRQALDALQRVCAVDPEDVQMHYLGMLCYRGLGMNTESEREAALFRRFKAEESSQSITGKRRLISPEDNNERQMIHDHSTVELKRVGGAQ